MQLDPGHNWESIGMTEQRGRMGGDFYALCCSSPILGYIGGIWSFGLPGSGPVETSTI